MICKEARDKRIFALWLACYTSEEIAEPLGLTRQAVEARLEELQKKYKSTNFAKLSFPDDFDIPLYNVWKQQQHDLLTHSSSTTKTDMENAYRAARWLPAREVTTFSVFE